MKKMGIVFLFVLFVVNVQNVFGQSDPKFGFTIGIRADGWVPFIEMNINTEKVDFSLGFSTSIGTTNFFWFRPYISIMPHIYSYDDFVVVVPIILSYSQRISDEPFSWIGIHSGIQVNQSLLKNFGIVYAVEHNIINFNVYGFRFWFFDGGDLKFGTTLNGREIL